MSDAITMRWEMQNEAGRRFFGRGDLARAEQAFLAAIREAEQLGANDVRLASSISNLAHLRYRQKAYDQALDLFRRSLAIREIALGATHPGNVQSINNLAAVHYARGEVIEAEAYYRRALEIAERALGAHHPDVVTSLNNLARLCFKRSDHASAEPLLLRLIGIKEQTLGPEHSELAPVLTSLAKVRIAQGAFADAEALCRRALAIRERETPPNPLAIASSLDALADVCARSGKRDEEAMLRRQAVGFRSGITSPALASGEGPALPQAVPARLAPPGVAPPSLDNSVFYVPDIGDEPRPMATPDAGPTVNRETPRRPVPFPTISADPSSIVPSLPDSPLISTPRHPASTVQDDLAAGGLLELEPLVPMPAAPPIPSTPSIGRKTPTAAPPPLPETPTVTPPLVTTEPGEELLMGLSNPRTPGRPAPMLPAARTPGRPAPSLSAPTTPGRPGHSLNAPSTPGRPAHSLAPPPTPGRPAPSLRSPSAGPTAAPPVIPGLAATTFGPPPASVLRPVSAPSAAPKRALDVSPPVPSRAPRPPRSVAFDLGDHPRRDLFVHSRRHRRGRRTGLVLAILAAAGIGVFLASRRLNGLPSLRDLPRPRISTASVTESAAVPRAADPPVSRRQYPVVGKPSAQSPAAGALAGEPRPPAPERSVRQFTPVFRPPVSSPADTAESDPAPPDIDDVDVDLERASEAIDASARARVDSAGKTVKHKEPVFDPGARFGKP